MNKPMGPGADIRPTPLSWTLIGLGVAPIAALIIAFLVQPDLADALGATLFYFTLPYLVLFPIFRRLTRHRSYRHFAAVPVALLVGYLGFWLGGLGVTTAYLLALLLPPYRVEAVD